MKRSPGRPKGSQNKITRTAKELADQMGVSPLEILLLFAKGDWEALGYEAEVYHSESAEGETKMGYVIKPEMRLNAASQACKYIYPTAKELTVSADENCIKVIIEDYSRKS